MASHTHIWGEFERWCTARRLQALPAHPWAVASYLRWVERRKDIAEVYEVVDVIARQHVLKTGRVPTRHATVKSTLKTLERRALVKDQHGDLFDEDAQLDKKPKPKPKPKSRKPAKSEADAVRKRHTLSTKPRMVKRRPKSEG